MVLRTFALMQLALPGMVLAINGVAAQLQLFGSKPEKTLVNVVKSQSFTISCLSGVHTVRKHQSKKKTKGSHEKMEDFGTRPAI
ncbi:hypothetical protein AV530_007839 [Patagioenas fasciata monilis]|uniref:Secreted protein n=1 Tax=Patagioenas fasciata monilis TaxID=372326 RepID=A0A1V4JT19_PATFA|nr:hypothetical protein AV530_007839 [Patagioenas fasciata monilis]